MKAVKILFSVLAFSVLTAAPILKAQDDKAPATGQEKGGRGGRGGRGGAMNIDDRVAAIEKAVGTLTAEQKTKIHDILAKQAEQMQAARGSGGGGGDRQANMAKMQEMRKATDDQIKALLTADQAKKYDEMRPARGQGGRQGRKKQE